MSKTDGDAPLPDLRALQTAGEHAATEKLVGAGATAAAAETCAKLIWLSDYAARHLPLVLATDLDLADPELATDTAANYVKRRFDDAFEQHPTDVAAALRQVRHSVHLRVLWTEWVRRAPVSTSFAYLSATADAVIRHAVAAAMATLTERHGELPAEDGQPTQLAVLAMGKLGGGELNFSSDIDLVFLYRADGTSNGPRPLSASEYFTRVAREVIRLIDTRTAQGFAYRVDARLRPFGDSGPLVVSFAAFENYLGVHGRDWERYAYLKARLVNPAADPNGELAALLERFVYRGYLDYGIFESLRDLKTQIEAQVRRGDRLDDLKLGPGGIREIEFIVQSLQLIRGGREPGLQQRHLPAALAALAEGGHLDDHSADELSRAYVFLRRVENAVQGICDEQTHQLPEAPIDRARVALAVGFDDLATFTATLARHRERVQRQFNASELSATGDAAAAPVAVALDLGVEEWKGRLERRGCDDSAPLATAIVSLQRSAAAKRLDKTSSERLGRVLPLLLDDLARLPDAAARFRRLQPVLEAVLRRSAYLAFLIEKPMARKRLVDWAGQSDFLSRELAANPILLDELLSQTDAADLVLDRLAADCATELARRNSDDVEQQLALLAEFQRVTRFRIALADFAGDLALMNVSDALTALAAVVIDNANRLAWQDNVARFGVPTTLIESERRPAAFAVIAYGKLGGFELGYGSDLDLVFLHDSDGAEPQTTGPKVVPNDVFFARHVRKLIHYLTYQTRLGRLYEVDVRLRPSGRSGLLVSSITAFERYQRRDAWTWEHQALLRSRAIVGDPELCQRFEALRRTLLIEAVRRDTLNDEVQKMRARMRRELSRASANGFDLKQDAGGLADLEFIVQYLVLAQAAQDPQLLDWPDNMRQLDKIAAGGWLADREAAALQGIYVDYRQCLHRQTLVGGDAIVPATAYEEQRATVRRIWQSLFED